MDGGEDAMSDFWDEMQAAYAVESAIDHHLVDHALDGDHFTQVRELADKTKEKKALKLPVEAGTRVRFLANLGSVLTYPDVPDTGVGGTVVTVRSANGDVTADDHRVFVMWDDGKFRPIMAEHLRRAKTNKKRANAVRIVTSDLHGLAAFFTPAMGSFGVAAGEDLVHKATKDLWSFKQDGDNFVIERLFTEGGEPLKV
jgi:hypothetical protein